MTERNSLLIAGGYVAVCAFSGSAVAMVAQILPASAWPKPHRQPTRTTT